VLVTRGAVLAKGREHSRDIRRPRTPPSDRSIHLLAGDGTRRVPSLAATIALLHTLDGRDWGLAAA
jgi:hypothetical protein